MTAFASLALASAWTQADRDAAAKWWRNMRRDSIKIAHLARRRFRAAGYSMVDILLLKEKP